MGLVLVAGAGLVALAVGAVLVFVLLRGARADGAGTDGGAAGGRRVALIAIGSALGLAALAFVGVRLARPDLLAPALPFHELPKPGHVAVSVCGAGERWSDEGRRVHALLSTIVESSLEEGVRFEEPMRPPSGGSFGGIASARSWVRGEVRLVHEGEVGPDGRPFQAVDGIDRAALLEELAFVADGSFFAGAAPFEVEASIAHLTADLEHFRVVALVHDGERFVFREVEPSVVYDEDRLAVFESTWSLER